MNIKFLSSGEKREIIKKLNEQYGIEELPYLLIQTGKERIRAYSGSLSKEEIMKLGDTVNVELIGIYLYKIEKDGLRLSHDTVSMLKKQITKNIVELDKKQAEDWMRGEDIELKAEKGFVVLKHKENLVGCGKSTGERIVNFVPKERRIR